MTRLRTPCGHRELAMLAEAVTHCTLCSRMHHRTKVLTHLNGSASSKVMFVAEAPGRLGADKTGVPLHGDATGVMFESLLSGVGWKREDVFVTNAVLCNPRDHVGNNARPTRVEIENCAAYLEMTINAVGPEAIVPMGAVALDALAAIHPHRMTLRDNVAQVQPWGGRVIFPLYHPGPRARIHRPLMHQRADMTSLAKLIDPRAGIKKRRPSQWKTDGEPSRSAFEQVIVALIGHTGKSSYFKLTKLLYLLDLQLVRQRGWGATGQVYLRAQEGPWPPELPKAVQRLDGHEVLLLHRGRKPLVEPGPSPRFSPHLEDGVLEVIADVAARYGDKTEAQLKTAVYLTDPMREIIVKERHGADLRNTIVLDGRAPGQVG